MAKKAKRIELGSKVEDEVTGYVGTVIAYTVHLTGCVQFAVKSKVDKDGKMPEAEWIDEERLKVIDIKKKIRSTPTGADYSLQQRI